ncbi:S8 family serine peptidase [Streptomyces cavernae]|uniref:S8 family serine peptidase n=1 Tax=Streptomyces cavernae TaxID=2259034 RepID=UPI000FEBE67A|nr:S8 family serine peptidase [Streptomyces cavernae]
MNKIIGATLLALVLASAPAASAAAPAPVTTKSDQTTDRYIVSLDTEATGDFQANAATVAAEHADAVGAKVRHVYRHALNGYAASMSPEAAAEVAKDPRVRSVQPDRPVHATAAQPTPTGVARVGTEKSPTAAIDGIDQRVNVDVAVIDTGISLKHRDLNVYQEGGKNCWLGWDFLPPDDFHGHGTHVAGTIGALDNSSGVVGVAPGARLWPVRVLSPLGSGSTSEVICGIDYVTEHADEIEVVNMSLGGAGTDDGNCGKTNNDPMHEAICNSVARGVTYVVAAGNDNQDAAKMVPAAYDEVITVSALADSDGKPGGLGKSTSCGYTDQDDTFANFSNHGADVDLIAPGVCIYSTWRFGGYNTISGTSMAAPHAAGGAALYKATHPGASPAQVKAALQAAGSKDWIWPSQDDDNIQEPLLDVSGF